MATAADSAELKTAFAEHLDETRGHLDRLNDVFATTGIRRTGEVCEAMRGLIREGSEIVAATGDPAAKDAALIAAAQRVEHYEIAAYGTATTLADKLGFNDAQDTLGETLGEENAADKRLTKIATGGFMRSGINEKAVR